MKSCVDLTIVAKSIIDLMRFFAVTVLYAGVQWCNNKEKNVGIFRCSMVNVDFLTGIALSQRRLILLHMNLCMWYHSLHVVHSIQLESVRQVFCICSTLQSIQYTL